jgi:hypothetical protein
MSIGKSRNVYSACSNDKICGLKRVFLFHCNLYNKTVFVRDIATACVQSGDEMTVMLTLIVCLNILPVYQNVDLSVLIKHSYSQPNYVSENIWKLVVVRNNIF